MYQVRTTRSICLFGIARLATTTLAFPSYAGTCLRYIWVTKITCERWQRSGPIHPTPKSVHFTKPFSFALTATQHCGKKNANIDLIVAIVVKHYTFVTTCQPLAHEYFFNKFQIAQRRYSGLFSFNVLGAGDITKRTLTEPPKEKSMLCLHGKVYHRIFDLQQQHGNMNVSNSGRFYIYASEFAEKCSSLNLDEIANTLRTHIHEIVQWAQDYRSAVDSVLNTPDLHNPDLPPPYI